MVALFLFDPKFWEVAGTYELLFCSKRNAASVVVTFGVVVGTLNQYKVVKNLTLHTKRWRGHKNLSIISSSLVLVLRDMRHLVVFVTLGKFF